MGDDTADFIRKGLTNYCAARRTLAHFESQVRQAARAALSGHFDSLSSAIGDPFPNNQPSPYSIEWPTGAWVAMKVDCPPPLSVLYVGIYWERDDDDGSQKAYAAADFDVVNRAVADRLCTLCGNVQPPSSFAVVNDYKNEVCMSAEFTADADALEKLLSDLLKEWERMFAALGGAAALKQTA